MRKDELPGNQINKKSLNKQEKTDIFYKGSFSMEDRVKGDQLQKEDCIDSLCKCVSVC